MRIFLTTISRHPNTGIPHLNGWFQDDELTEIMGVAPMTGEPWGIPFRVSREELERDEGRAFIPGYRNPVQAWRYVPMDVVRRQCFKVHEVCQCFLPDVPESIDREELRLAQLYDVEITETEIVTTEVKMSAVIHIARISKKGHLILQGWLECPDMKPVMGVGENLGVMWLPFKISRDQIQGGKAFLPSRLDRSPNWSKAPTNYKIRVGERIAHILNTRLECIPEEEVSPWMADFILTADKEVLVVEKS
ncbi:MAG: hypothetical protein D6698_16515 [Gammaproteobacteria bacterium]|nr:MAG: hypothetical protein D6698_16515 [Gammaproteobacteria bacterium]